MSSSQNALLWQMPKKTKLPEPIAFYTISNWYGIGIIEMTDDWVKFAFYADDENNYNVEGTEEESIFESDIEWVLDDYDEEDEDPPEFKPSFKHGDSIYFLEDFIRTNYGSMSNLKLDWKDVQDEQKYVPIILNKVNSPETAAAYIADEVHSDGDYYPDFRDLENPFVKGFIDTNAKFDQGSSNVYFIINDEKINLKGEYLNTFILNKFTDNFKETYESIKDKQVDISPNGIGDYISIEPLREHWDYFGPGSVWETLAIMNRALVILGTEVLNDNCFVFIKNQLDQYIQQYILSLQYTDSVEKYKEAGKLCYALLGWKKYFLADQGQSIINAINYLHTLIPAGNPGNDSEKRNKLSEVQEIHERLLRIIREGRYSSLKLNWNMTADKVPTIEYLADSVGDRIVFLLNSHNDNMWSCWSATISSYGSFSDTEKFYENENFQAVKEHAESFVRDWNSNYGIKEERKKDLTTKCWYYESIDEDQYHAANPKLDWQVPELKIGDEVFDNTSGEILGNIKEFVGPTKKYVTISIPNTFKYLLEQNPSGLITVPINEVDSDETYSWQYPDIDREASLKLDWATFPDEKIDSTPQDYWKDRLDAKLVVLLINYDTAVLNLNLDPWSITAYYPIRSDFEGGDELTQEFGKELLKRKKEKGIDLNMAAHLLFNNLASFGEAYNKATDHITNELGGDGIVSTFGGVRLENENYSHRENIFEFAKKLKAPMQLDWANVQEKTYSFEEFKQVVGPNQVWKSYRGPEVSFHFLHIGQGFEIEDRGYKDEIFIKDAIYSADSEYHSRLVWASVTKRQEPLALVSGELKTASLQLGDKVKINSDVYQIDFQDSFGYDSKNLKGRTFEIAAVSEENNTVKLKSGDIVLNEKYENEDKTFSKVAWAVIPEEFKTGDEVAWLLKGNDGKEYTVIGKIDEMVSTKGSKETRPYVSGRFTEEDGTTHSLGMFIHVDRLHRFPPTEPFDDDYLWQVPISRYELVVRVKEDRGNEIHFVSKEKGVDLTLEEVIDIINIAPTDTDAENYYSVHEVSRNNRDLDYPDAMIYVSYLSNNFHSDTGTWYSLTPEEEDLVKSLVTVPQRKNFSTK